MAQNQTSYGRPVAFADAMIAASLACTAAHGDVGVSYTNSTHYNYTVSHVPDFDQRRFLLDNAGNNHCVPTSAINWMAYFCNHGVDWLEPGAGNWQSQSLYDAGTNAIEDMGDLMGTSGANGTTGSGGWYGLTEWLDPPIFLFFEDFTVTQQHMGLYSAPRFQDLSLHVINGAFVMPGVGWYQEFKFEPGVIQRDGGHMLSLNFGSRNGSAMTIGWRDPAKDEGQVFERLFVQSNFASEQYAIDPRQRMPIMNGVVQQERTMDKILSYGSGYLDGYFAIYPLFALASLPNEFEFGIAKHLGFALNGSNSTRLNQIEIDNLPLLSIAMHPDQLQIAYVAGDHPTMSIVNMATGEITPIDVGLNNLTKAVFGRYRNLYVIDGDGMYCINLDQPQPEIEGFVIPPHIPDAICYDDATDQVKLLSATDRKVMAYPWHLKGGPVTFSLPLSVQVGGEADMAADPLTGGVWFVSEASDIIYHAKTILPDNFVVVTPIMNAGVQDPTSVDVGDRGRVFVAAHDKVHEFVPVIGGAWQESDQPIFADIEVGNIFRIARSRTNFDPELHVASQWYDLLPEEGLGDSIPDCTADLTLDGEVDGADLGQLLIAWGGADIFADLNADLAVDGADLGALLLAWGPCDG